MDDVGNIEDEDRTLAKAKSEAVSSNSLLGNVDKFFIKQYSKDERPILKGNGFDGLEIGEDRGEAQEFVDFINKLIPNVGREPPGAETGG